EDGDCSADGGGAASTGTGSDPVRLSTTAPAWWRRPLSPPARPLPKSSSLAAQPGSQCASHCAPGTSTGSARDCDQAGSCGSELKAISGTSTQATSTPRGTPTARPSIRSSPDRPTDCSNLRIIQPTSDTATSTPKNASA